MVKKLIITPFFGELPSWFDKWQANFDLLKPLGYDHLMTTDLDAFKQRVADKLGIGCPIVSGGVKLFDFRMALGLLYQEELEGYDFWGHTDFDCVYGKVDHFVTDDFLANLDFHSDCLQYMCGPWSLYRNTERVNKLFMEHPEWKTFLGDANFYAWGEKEYSRLLERSGIRYRYTQFHEFTNPDALYYTEDGRLHHGGREIMMYHFRRTKVWPACPTR